MKNYLFGILTTLICFNLSAQFEIKTEEDQNGVSKYSVGKSNGMLNESGIVVQKVLNGSFAMKILINKGVMLDANDYSEFDEMKVTFVFKGAGGATHKYITTSGGYQLNGYKSTLWIFFNDDKLIEYFKKYNSVVVYTGNTLMDKYDFSLGNFTSCLKQL